MFQSPVKNTNEITNNANTTCPFKFFEVCVCVGGGGAGGINYQNQPTFCGKNGSLIRSWRVLDKITRSFYSHSLSLHRQDVITQSPARRTADTVVTSSSQRPAT